MLPYRLASGPSRRSFVVGGAACGAALLVGGCRDRPIGLKGDGDGGAGPPRDAEADDPGHFDGRAGPDGPLVPTLDCPETVENIEGPYYRQGAPERRLLVDPADLGERLTLSGRIFAPDCSAIGAALLDVWQADAAGVYDATGFRWRGQSSADGLGNYSIETLIPGRYLNGLTYRPAHIHFKVSAPGFTLLTTQLYFPGDPFNDADPFIDPSLIMDLSAGVGGVRSGRFDFVLGRGNG